MNDPSNPSGYYEALRKARLLAHLRLLQAIAGDEAGCGSSTEVRLVHRSGDEDAELVVVESLAS